VTAGQVCFWPLTSISSCPLPGRCRGRSGHPRSKLMSRMTLSGH
jgi:hypothetical protein